MVHAKDVETRSLECNSRILKDVMIDFATTEMIWQKDLRKTSMIGRSHWRHEQDLMGLMTLKIYWPLEDQTLLYAYVRCDDCELSFVWCFSTATTKICLFKTFVCIVCIPLYLSYLTPKPLEPIEDEWRWTHIFWTDDSIGDGPMDSEHGRSHEE